MKARLEATKPYRGFIAFTFALAVLVYVMVFAPYAQATTPKPTVNVTVDAANCVARVDVSWTGKTGTAGVQVNVDHHGAQNDATDKRRLTGPNGDDYVATPGSYTYHFTLAQGAAHVIEAGTQGHGFSYGETWQRAQVDCTTPVPPTIVEVPVENRVEVPVDRVVPGPTVRVPVTKLVRVRTKCELKMKDGRKVFFNCRKPRVKPDCKAPKRWHPGLKRCFTPRKPKREPQFTG